MYLTVRRACVPVRSELMALSSISLETQEGLLSSIQNMKSKTWKNRSSRGNLQNEGNPPVAPRTAVNRTSDVGVRRISCKNSGNKSKIKESKTNERNRSQQPTFNYKVRTLIGAWNVRTLLDLGKYEQAEREMLQANIQIMCISETKWRGLGEHTSSTGKTCMLYSGEDEHQTGPRIGGVGIMLTTGAKHSLISWAPISKRLISARFRSRVRNITIIHCYAPTEDAEEEAKLNFYTQLSNAYDSAPKADIKIVIGDLNAKVGTENVGLERVMGRHGMGTRNNNGEMLVDFCNERQLTIGGTLFPHKTCHKVTWVSPNGQVQNQIDHCIIQQRWRKSLCDVRNRRSADIGSDHHLVVASLQLRTAAVQRRLLNQTRIPKFDVNGLKDPSTCRNFVNKLRDRTATSNNLISINDRWDHIKKAFIDTGLENVPSAMRRRGDQWMSQASWDLIDRRKQLKNNINHQQHQHQRDILRTQYQEAHKLTQRSVRRDRRKHMEDLAKKAETAAARNDAAELYKITRQISGRKNRAQKPIADENGKLLVTMEDQLRRWREHFCKLLNDQFVEQSTPVSPQNRRSFRGIDTGNPTVQEIKSAISSLKNNKAAGIDGIPAEFLKADPDTTASILLPLFQAIWEEEIYPSDWKEGVIAKIPKKGSLTNCNNWRGISLLSVFSKLMARIVLERIKERINSTLKKHQTGFRSGHSCVDNINTLRIIIEQSTELNSPLHLMFVDFEKAFDRVKQEYIWKSLNRRGIPEKIVAIIKASYENARSYVLHCGQLTEPFEVQQGVRQGCILSPILFLTVVDDVMTTAVGENERNGIQWHTFKRLSHLDYADDVCLMAHSSSALNEMCQALHNNGIKVGLKINVEKTKIIRTSRSTHQAILFNEVAVGEVEQFKYLGSILTPDGGAELDIENRISKARTAFGALSRVWQSNAITMRTKLRIFETNVKSVLLYACETWKVTATITKKLQVYINRCLRRILKIRWPRIISNRALWQQTNQVAIDVEIRKRKWRWIGHTLRKDNTEIAKQALDWNPQGTRRVGRPKKTWRTTVLAEAGSQQKTWLQVKRLAKERERWKEFVSALCPNRG